MKKSAILSICVLLSAAFCTVAALSSVSLARGLHSLRWPHVSGSLLKVNQDQYPASSLDYVTARYTYQVDGQHYTGDTISLGCFGPRFNSADLAKPAQSSVSVYYNPRRPQQAVLFPGVSSLDYLLPLVFGGLGALAAYGSWRVERDYDDVR